MTPERGEPLSTFAADETHGASLAWKRHDDGSITEVQADGDGTILEVRRICAADAEDHGTHAASYLLPDAVRAGLRAPEGTLARPFVAELLGTHTSVGLWLRLAEDGSYRRAIALLDGGVLVISADRNGTLTSLRGLEGFGGLLAMDLEDRTRESLIERHAKPVRVPTLGAAIAHARSAGSGVLGARETDDPTEIRLVCEAPDHPTTLWFPHLGGIGRGPVDAVNRFTRSYRISDRSRPDTSWLEDEKPTYPLPSHRLSMLLSALTHAGRPGRRSGEDMRLAIAIARTLLARVAPDDVPRDGDGRVEKTVRKNHPEHFNRAGLEALLGTLQATPAASLVVEDRLAPLRADLTERLSTVKRGGDLVNMLLTHHAPRPNDAVQAFSETWAPAAARASATLMQNPPPAESIPAHYSALRVHLAPAPLLGGPHPLSAMFPGGYRRIAHQLAPEGIWATWVHHAPGKTSGLRMDGLVWLGDHWAWFPKPWKLLRRRS